MKRDDTDILTRSSLFRGIAVGKIEGMIRSANPAEKQYRTDEVVAFAGAPYERLLLILEGVLATEIVDYSGKTLKMERFRESQSIAAGILFATDNTLPVRIFAESDSRLLAFSRAAVLSMCRDNPVFLENFLQTGGDRVKLLAAKLRFHQFNTIKQ
jgi:CRP/FNR family transcriptional regulator, dissimilatory nitrate respiration regulator